MRQGGILLPIFSLPNRYGIGCLSKEAFDFADFLRAAGVSCWQMLPFGPTSFGDSPYQSYSTFAGNPYFIDLEELIRLGLLTQAECDAADLSADPEKVDYKSLEEGRIPLLKRAYERAMKDRALMKAVDAFSADQAHWLPDYALFMALKDENDGKSFQDWDDEGVRLRRPAALEMARKRLSKEIGYYTWTQYEFDREWQALRRHCAGTAKN
jgi:4-alpha-glucanotransferase